MKNISSMNLTQENKENSTKAHHNKDFENKW